MYINPFVGGVLSTLFVELLAILIYGLIVSGKDKDNENNKNSGNK